MGEKAIFHNSLLLFTITPDKIELRIAVGYTALKNEFFQILVFSKFLILANTLRKEILAKKNFLRPIKKSALFLTAPPPFFQKSKFFVNSSETIKFR